MPARTIRPRPAARRGVPLLGMLIVLAVAPSAGAEPSGGDRSNTQQIVQGPYVTAIRAGETVRYEYSASLRRSRTNTYQGTRIPGEGCSYRGEGAARGAPVPTAQVEVEREIRQDLRTCTMITESAILSPAEAAQAGFRAEAPRSGGTTVEQGVGSGPELNDDFHTNFGHRGHLKTYYEEPAQGDTSTVEAHVGWTFDGNCVTGWGKHAYWHWLNDTGWTDVNLWADWPGDCKAQTARVYGLFKNGVFCGTNDTFNEYNTTQYTGWWDGGASWSWNAKKWGGCNWLLSFHREAYYLGQRVQG